MSNKGNSGARLNHGRHSCPCGVNLIKNRGFLTFSINQSLWCSRSRRYTFIRFSQATSVRLARSWRLAVFYAASMTVKKTDRSFGTARPVSAQLWNWLSSEFSIHWACGSSCLYAHKRIKDKIQWRFSFNRFDRRYLPCSLYSSTKLRSGIDGWQAS